MLSAAVAVAAAVATAAVDSVVAEAIVVGVVAFVAARWSRTINSIMSRVRCMCSIFGGIHDGCEYDCYGENE